MTAQQNSKNQQAHKDINTSQARQSITKTIERIQNIAQYDPNNKKNPRAVAKERKEAIDNFVKEETERVYNRLAKGDGLEAHFRSIGRLLTHYNKKNQVFIKAQRPDTAGVASRGTWERHGYTIPNGTRPITVTQSYKYVLNNSRHVNDWLKENPLLDIVKWYQSKIKTTKQPQLFMFLCTLRGVWESGMSSQHVQGIVLSSGAIVFSLWCFYRYFRSVGTEKAQYTIVRVLPFVGIVLIPLLIWLL
jgi:hypothetical protein